MRVTGNLLAPFAASDTAARRRVAFSEGLFRKNATCGSLVLSHPLSDALDRGRMTAETPADRDKADAALAAAGDTQAFERLVVRWQGRLLGLAWRFCRDRAMAEDMTQEAFVRAYRALPRFRSDAAFGTWLTAIALNSYRTALRDRPPVPVELPAAVVRAGSDGTVARLVRQEQDGNGSGASAAAAREVPDRDGSVLFPGAGRCGDGADSGARRKHAEGEASQGPATTRAPPSGPRHYESVSWRRA